jgi:hypothetical protein
MVDTNSVKYKEGYRIRNQEEGRRKKAELTVDSDNYQFPIPNSQFPIPNYRFDIAYSNAEKLSCLIKYKLLKII